MNRDRRLYLNRIYFNIKKYNEHKLASWSDIEETADYNSIIHNINILDALESLNTKNFKENILIQLFNKEELKIEDSLKNMFKNFRIKVIYYVINNLSIVNNSFDDIIKEMRCKKLLNNSELYFLNLNYSDCSAFEKVMNKYQTNFNAEAEKTRILVDKLKIKYQNII